MFDESYLIDVIKNNSPYSDVDYADDSTIHLPHIELITPKIFVGHLGIQLQNKEDTVADGYHEIENSEVLLTAIQVLCLRKELATVRTNIKKAYSGKSPFLDDSDYSSLVFMEASVVAKTSDKIWWQEIVGLIMPRVS